MNTELHMTVWQLFLRSFIGEGIWRILKAALRAARGDGEQA